MNKNNFENIIPATEERQNIVARNDLRTFKSCVNNQPKLFQLKTPLIIEQTDVFI